MTTLANEVAVRRPAPPGTPPRRVRLALLGLGQVGSAIASLVAGPQDGGGFTITSALVRDLHRRRAIDTAAIPLTTDHRDALATNPDVLVEVLGGLEPARSLVLAALAAGVPVVTANKSLIAAHGDELFDAAAQSGAPLLYEASVLAGVPFLGTFRRRPLARSLTGLRGIVNGTSNFILSSMARDGVAFDDALGDAQRAGFAEADPSKDVQGDDAVEKLCVLLRHFGDFSVQPADIASAGIVDVAAADLQHAAAFGGAIRPVIHAEWGAGQLKAYAGPAFVDGASALCRVDGVQNAIALTTRWSGELFFSGPGAGPTVTAATVLDDVVEAQQLVNGQPPRAGRPLGAVGEPETGWFVRLSSAGHGESDAQGLLSGLGLRLRRVSAIDTRSGTHRQWLLTHPCVRPHLAAALEVFAARTGAAVWCIRSVD